MPRDANGAPPADVTRLLARWSRGEQEALNELLPIVYGELRRMAGRQLRAERQEHTLTPTALVHEVYLRLVDQRRAGWQNRTQFFAVAARLMRRLRTRENRTGPHHGPSRHRPGAPAAGPPERATRAVVRPA